MSRNLAGAYTRARVAPVNRRTPKQTQVRLNFALNSKMWSGALTADQRAAWTLFAQANPVPNRLGDSIILSGLAMFNRLNQVLSQIGSPPVLDAPTDLSVPALASALSYDPSAAGSILVNTDAQAVVSGAKYYISATGCLAAGRTPPTSGYRFMAALPGVAAATTLDIQAAFNAAFGPGATGGVGGVSVATVNTDTGALTPALIFYGTF